MTRSSHEDAASPAEQLPRPPTQARDRRRWAWFLDVDGTLLEIERHPDHVSADAALLDLLERLDDRYGGAVALISGRSLAQLERIFGPLRVAAAASHGLEMRLAGGDVTLLADPVPESIAEEIAALTEAHPGLHMEKKSFSIGVHFRGRPELAGLVEERLEKIAAEPDNGYRLQHGKMVIELLPGAAGKGEAIRSFMARPPFRGRRPIFVGDDITDEHGFAAVNELDGMSIRVGDSPGTSARWRLDDVSDLRTWLGEALRSRTRRKDQ